MIRSGGWSLILSSAVADQASVDVPTPGYDDILADPASAQLAVGNLVVIVPDQATVTFNGPTATVTNLTGEDWPTATNVYVYVAAKGVTGDTFAQVGDNSTAITTMQGQIADLEARVAALEAAP